MPFTVIYDASDTRIDERPESYFMDDEIRFETFEEARQEVIEYLDELLKDVQFTLDFYKSWPNQEDYTAEDEEGINGYGDN